MSEPTSTPAEPTERPTWIDEHPTFVVPFTTIHEQNAMFRDLAKLVSQMQREARARGWNV